MNYNSSRTKIYEFPFDYAFNALLYDKHPIFERITELIWDNYNEL